MVRTTHTSQSRMQAVGRGARFRRSFAQSTYITASWTWFMVLAGNAAEPVLVSSVLYASVKLLPIIHFPPQFDVVVFVAQFIALDVGGLSLNRLADQALKEGNVTGARLAKRLSIALVSVMLAGVIIAGIDQVVKLDGQISTIVDTILLIGRAIMSVLYSRVIHALKEDAFEADEEAAQEFMAEAMSALTRQIKADQVEQTIMLREWIATTVNEVVSDIKTEQFELLRDLSQQQEKLFNLLDVQTQAELRAKEPLTSTLVEAVTAVLETSLTRHAVPLVASEICEGDSCETKNNSQGGVSENSTVSLETGVSQKQMSHETDCAEPGISKIVMNEIDKAVWPLLDAGKTVRAIAAESSIKNATVGRSRLRWSEARRADSASPNQPGDRSHEVLPDETCVDEFQADVS